MVLRAFSLFTLVVLTKASAVIAADTNPPPRLTVELRDGSRVVGTSVEKHLKFHSALLGDLKLAVKDIRSIDCVATNSGKLSTANGDLITVSFADDVLAIKASFGKLDLTVNSIRKLSVSAAHRGAHPPGLVALWSGEGDGRDTIGEHDATSLNGVSFKAGKLGEGFDFDGSPTRMRVADAPELNVPAGQDFSIAAWIAPLHAPDNSPADEMTICSKRYAPNPYNYVGYVFYIANGGQLFFLMGDAPIKTGGLIVNAGPDLRDGKFHYVAVTVQRNSSTGGHLFVDGESVLTFDPSQQSGSLVNNESFLIGHQNTPGYVTTFKGMMDELAFYNRALSPEEIKEDYAAGNAD